MGIDTQKYVRKPLFVDAVKVTEDNFAEIAEWCQGTITDSTTNEQAAAGLVDPANQYIHVRVHNPKNTKQTRAMVGDWILYTERGYKVYSEKAFFGAFDAVLEGNSETLMLNPDQAELTPIPEDANPGENAGQVEATLEREPNPTELESTDSTGSKDEQVDTDGSAVTAVAVDDEATPAAEPEADPSEPVQS